VINFFIFAGPTHSPASISKFSETGRLIHKLRKAKVEVEVEVKVQVQVQIEVRVAS